MGLIRSPAINSGMLSDSPSLLRTRRAIFTGVENWGGSHRGGCSHREDAGGAQRDEAQCSSLQGGTNQHLRTGHALGSRREEAAEPRLGLGERELAVRAAVYMDGMETRAPDTDLKQLLSLSGPQPTHP